MATKELSARNEATALTMAPMMHKQRMNEYDGAFTLAPPPRYGLM
jgi:hypothetical protein